MKKIIVLISCIVLSITASAQYTKLLDFSGTADGDFPYGSLFSDGTFLYGMTGAGGAYNKGTIFKIKPDGTAYTKLLDFNLTNGNYPWGTLISDGTFLYGTTQNGGANNDGVIFKIMPDGSNFSKIYDFSGTADGKWPDCSLIFDGTFLYGTASQGGTSNMGTIFKIRTDGTGYTKLFDFSGTADGMNPLSSLIFNDTAMYGTTRNGGANGKGVIFKIMPDGSGYSDLYDFPGYPVGGANPDSYLISDGTFLYGMTNNGGTNGYGLIFKIKPDGTGYSDLYSLSPATDGSNPSGALVSDGTLLYGTTYLGGANNKGTFFSIKPDGTGYSVLVNFSGAADGALSYNTPMFDGTSLYGMIYSGGIHNAGVLFKYQPAISTGITKDDNEKISIYPNPTDDVLNIILPPSENNNVSIEIYNSIGALVYTKQTRNESTEIELANQATGIYFIKVMSDDKIIAAKKIIKQ